MKNYIRIHEKDNVAVAIREIAAGETIEIGGLQVKAQEEIPAGHRQCQRGDSGRVLGSHPQSGYGIGRTAHL